MKSYISYQILLNYYYLLIYWIIFYESNKNKLKINIKIKKNNKKDMNKIFYIIFIWLLIINI